MANANLSFLAWARQGAASAIKTDDAPGVPAVATVTAKLTLNGAALPDVPVRLRGPADVLGIDPNQVVRTDPRAAAIDFESNCFPSIEFDRPDFPWLFTPARANASKQLRPWLCLVAVARQAGVSLDTPAGAPLAQLHISSPAKPDVELPNLADSWAWAHAQVAADVAAKQPIADALNGPPEMALSRLVCPRVLAPETNYIACVVPAFDLGRKTGLGLPVSDADLAAADALKPAWAAGAADVLLPVYYHWEFRTGPGGDFESIAAKLTADTPDGLGRRSIDISHPGFGAAGATSADLEGALKAIVPANTPPPPDVAPPAAFQTTLAGILNAPGKAEKTPAADAVLAPPIYGRWHAGRAAVTVGGATWLDQLNLDPRWRVPAAFGTSVIQVHQEALMASAWEQAADLHIVNQRLRQLQMSRSVGEVLHARHFAKFSDEQMLRVAGPALARLRKSGDSMLSEQAKSRLPMGANRSAMRRIARQRGPLTRRFARQGVNRADSTPWVAQMMAPSPPPGPPTAPPAPALATWPGVPAGHLGSDSFWGAFFVSPENQPAAFPGDPVLVAGRTEIPGFFRAAALKHLAGFFPPRAPGPAPDAVVELAGVKDEVLAQLRPRDTVRALAQAIVSTGDNVLAANAPGRTATGLEAVMAAPKFPAPMYETLRELSQSALLPGLETVKPETVLGLQTNARFIESFMVGLNHEMTRELLWRGFPTDQRGTYFAHFWSNADPKAVDIDDLNTWRTRPLGASPVASTADEFVMLLRSRLLARYPNAVIYMTPAIAGATPGAIVPNPDPAKEVMPAFTGAMDPDLSFFGFPVSTAAATGTDGKGGYYVVIQEHPTEPRFGLNLGATAAGVSYLSIGGPLPTGMAAWGKTSAEMASFTRRHPTRVAIHAARLITHAA
jgi:hypothetical protein